jgi:dipeptidyl aminopeptidase/acylaminoacyl peptidase
VLGYAETYLRTEWTFFDDQVQRDFVALGKLAAGEPSIVSRTTDDRLWLVELRRDDGPEAYYLYDRNRGEGRPLFTSRRELQDVTLVPMRPVEIPARDGRVLPSYLSLPAGSTTEDGRPRERVPLVLRVHGGPWWRDSWGYDPFHQWLASRGYAVLSVNFRGSAGFGKSFLNAGDREWAGRMHDDLVDAAAWAVAQGYTSNDTIAIYGASYGGYAALVGLTFTPRTFACAIDVVGPSNLVTFIENAPPYWAPLLPVLNTKLADPTTPDGREWLLAHSPLSFVDRIERPLLIGHGANDPRVKEKESRQIVDAMVKRQIPVTFVRFPDEGHGFERPENLKAFTGIAEAFLASCLGGRYSPLRADTLQSSAEVPVGAEEIPGLTEALAERARSREPVEPGGAGTRDR